MHLSEVNTLLYHAIPLNDFKTYAKEGGILSRERLSSVNPYFTRFFSDPKDVKLKCWNRTFANFTDLGANFAFLMLLVQMLLVQLISFYQTQH